MQNIATHQMKFRATHPSGAEEWVCPTCGRRLLIQCPVGYEKITLERGDKHVLVWGRAIGTAVAEKIVLEVGDAYPIHQGAPDTLATEDMPVYEQDEYADEESPIGRLAGWRLPEEIPDDDAPLTPEWRRLLEEAGFAEWWQ